VEVLVTLALLGILAIQVVPSFVVWRQQQQLEGAIRHLALEMARVCARAVASGRTHALRFDASGEEFRWVAAVDGDGDGVSLADLDAGVDAMVGAEASLKRSFPGILPGRPAGVPTVSGGAADRAGLAFGSSPVVSCSPTGGARSGSLYLRSAAGSAAALRVYGATARLSLWWWDRDRPGWHRLR
jgi:type II secretory pathway pseudopilin PulG